MIIPKPTNKPLIKSTLYSLSCALRGVVYVFKHEKNFRLHITSAIIVLLLAIYFNCSLVEIALLIIVISVVLMAEMINSAIEYSWDKLEPTHHPVVGMIKDIMAGSVIIASLSALLVGAIIIIRHII